MRCPWCEGDELYQRYHDQEWGTPCFDDARLFEYLILDGAQAGLSWITVLRKRENYRRAFDGFDAERMAHYDERKKAELLQDAGIIRNRLKVDSAVRNARAYLAIRESEASFADFLWRFVDHRPLQHRYRTPEEVPATSPESDAMSRALKRAGFNFVGSTICYAVMQGVGMVNDHLVNCFRHEECRAQAASQ